MNYEQGDPFDSIESAREFIELLAEAIQEARQEVETDITRAGTAGEDRRKQALQLVSYILSRLSVHITTSRRILNDLRTLRRLLLQERVLEKEPAE
jgi:hypothetical protein